MIFLNKFTVARVLTFVLMLAGLLCGVLFELNNPFLPPFDGPWQESDAVRRLLNGGIPGRDFAIFHGIGAIWIHAPLYMLVGGGDYGAVFTHFMTPLLMILVLFFLAIRMITSENRAVFWVILVVTVIGFLPKVSGFLNPGLGMNSTRAVIGLLFLFLIFRMYYLSRNLNFRSISFSLLKITGLLGLAGALFSDLALILPMSFSAFVFFDSILSKRPRLLLFFCSLLSFVVAPILQWCFTAGDPSAQWHLQYNEQVATQFWFLGPPHNFLIDVKDVFSVVFISQWLAWFLHVAAILVGFFDDHFYAQSEKSRKIWALHILFLIYGLASVLLPSLGYASPHYGVPLGLSACLILFLRLYHLTVTLPLLEGFGNVGRLLVAFLVCVCSISVHIGYRSYTLGSGLSTSSQNRTAVSDIRDQAIYVKHRGEGLSFFSGSLEYHLGRQQELPGSLFYLPTQSSQAAYSKSLASGRYNWVSVPAGSAWNEWMITRWWPIFRTLLDRYEFGMRSGSWSTFVRPSGGRERWGQARAVGFDVSEKNAAGEYSFEIDSLRDFEKAGLQVLEVTITYKTQTDHNLEVFGTRLSRWVVDRVEMGAGKFNRFTIPPSPGKTTTMKFPIFVRGKGPHSVTIRNLGILPIQRIEVDDISVQVLGFIDSDICESLCPLTWESVNSRIK